VLPTGVKGRLFQPAACECRLQLASESLFQPASEGRLDRQAIACFNLQVNDSFNWQIKLATGGRYLLVSTSGGGRGCWLQPNWFAL